MFVNKGQFSVRTHNEFIAFEQGKGMLAKCFDYFIETTESQRASGDNIEVLGILLHSFIVEELFQFDTTISTHRVDFDVKQVQVDALLANYKESINLLLENPELADDATIKLKLKEFVRLISKMENAPSQLDFLSAMFRLNTIDFKTTINKNLYSSLSMEEFAKLSNMSLSSFKRKFNETFGESPKKYISKMKMKRAEQMLAIKENRISHIAYECGFESVSAFNRNFKAHFNQSPSEYRLSQNA